MNNLRLQTILFATAITLVLSGCPEEKDSTESDSAENKQTELQMKKDTDKADDKPQVSTSKSGQSKPLSESAGGAEKLKKDELYVVPNRFPEKELLEEEKEKQKEKTKEEQQDEPPR